MSLLNPLFYNRENFVDTNYTAHAIITPAQWFSSLLPNIQPHKVHIYIVLLTTVNLLISEFVYNT